MTAGDRLNQNTTLRAFVFIAAIFLISCVFQGVRWRELGLTDSGVWGQEAHYVLVHDPRELDPSGAYGYPGGPVIEGAIAVHELLHIQYSPSVIIFVTVFGSLVIAGTCALAYILRKRSLWWVAVLGILSLNWLYDYGATPPSVVAALLIVFLCLMTLLIYEDKEQPRPASLVLWALASGLAVATRADIGGFFSVVFVGLLIPRVGWKKALLLAIGAVLTFIVFDPFMWFMPIQHTEDLVFKMGYYYAAFKLLPPLTPLMVLTFSSLTLVSMFLGVAWLFLRKRLFPALPPVFLSVLLIATALFYGIILTSHFQQVRYFFPLTFIWEIFLPLFIFSLIDNVHFSFISSPEGEAMARKIFQVFIIVLLFAYNLSFLIEDLILANTFHLLP